MARLGWNSTTVLGCGCLWGEISCIFHGNSLHEENSNVHKIKKLERLDNAIWSDGNPPPPPPGFFSIPSDRTGLRCLTPTSIFFCFLLKTKYWIMVLDQLWHHHPPSHRIKVLESHPLNMGASSVWPPSPSQPPYLIMVLYQFEPTNLTPVLAFFLHIFLLLFRSYVQVQRVFMCN